MEKISRQMTSSKGETSGFFKKQTSMGGWGEGLVDQSSFFYSKSNFYPVSEVLK